MELTDELKAFFIETAKTLKGSDRRIFMARVVKALGKGGQRHAEAELGWNRRTIRKGTCELESGTCFEDNIAARGRKRAEEHLPNLLDDIKAIADAQSQVDPTFKTTRLYTRLSAAEVRRQLILQNGYSDEDLPSEETIRVKLNQLGYQVKSVPKSRPQKKIPETDAIFDLLDKANASADEDETVLRLSMDAKATIPIGLFSRYGKSRIIVKAMDHDFKPDEKLTPYGIFLPKYDELYLYFTSSHVTSDFIVDCLDDFWLTVQARFPQIKTLLLNQDNGPENHSRRTRFMKRITEFTDEFDYSVSLLPSLPQQIQPHRTRFGCDGKTLEWQPARYC